MRIQHNTKKHAPKDFNSSSHARPAINSWTTELYGMHWSNHEAACNWNFFSALASHALSLPPSLSHIMLMGVLQPHQPPSPTHPRTLLADSEEIETSSLLIWMGSGNRSSHPNQSTPTTPHPRISHTDIISSALIRFSRYSFTPTQQRSLHPYQIYKNFHHYLSMVSKRSINF